MLTIDSILRRSSEEIVAKVMDGEVVIINLETGTYYSADGVGGFVWELLESGLRLSAVGRVIEARYDVDAARIDADVLGFARELVREGLLDGADETGQAHAIPESAENKRPYEPPRLQIYRDMEELLALDPPTPGLADLRWKG